ncbi:hypothetical protein N2W54_007837 [Lotmaria passim]
MNQLEYFLASTDGSRADVMRYMQQLRDLDEWIEYHLTLLRAIAARRVVHLAATTKEENSRRRGTDGRSRGKGRGRGVGRDSPDNAASSRLAYDVNEADSNGDDAGRGSGNSAASSPAAASAYMAQLQRQFEWHEKCVRQHCEERELLAAELAVRCTEVRLSMASRLANFASVADGPVTELSS